MPPNSYDLPTPVDLAAGGTCPKCGAETEPIDVEAEGLPIEQLQLCPACYLVIWHDRNGLQVRQGVPVKKGADSQDEPPWWEDEPAKC